MAKTNYTKVEEVLTEGLRKINVAKLLEEADHIQDEKDPATLAREKKEQQDHALISALQRDLKELDKNQEVCKKLGIKKKEVKKFIEHPETLTPQDWEKLTKLRSQIEEFKKEMSKNLPDNSDEALIEQERFKHINKRFNVKDKWIPLK